MTSRTPSLVARRWRDALAACTAMTVGACGLGGFDELADNLGEAGIDSNGSEAAASDASEDVGDDVSSDDAADGNATDGGPDVSIQPDGSDGSVEATASEGGRDAGRDADAAPVLDGAPDGTVQPHGVPAIFYVPHQDDDYLAMALGIREHMARPVKVILYTTGGNSGLRDIMNGHDPDGNPVECPLYGSSDPAFAGHPQFHAYDLNDQDIKDIRTKEFERSMAALGVTDIVETGWDDDAVTGKDDDPFTAKLKALILQNEIAYPGTSHKCVSGPQDCGSTGGQPHPTHIACYYAAKELMADYPNGVGPTKTYWDFRFYDDYIYFSANPTVWNKWPAGDYDLSRFMPEKRLAFEAYHQWDPANSRYALGYHSVPFLFDNAKNDTYVHMESIESTPLNFKCPNE